MKKCPVYIILFFVLLTNFSTNADIIILAADEWCPINCALDTSAPGIMIELAQKIFSEYGHYVVYKIEPWSRAIVEAREGRINGVIGAFKGDAPDFIFPKNALLYISGNTLFALNDCNWNYSDSASLLNVKIGAIRSYDYGELMNQHLQKKENVYLLGGNKPLERLIKMVIAKRVNVIVEASPVFWYTVNEMGLSNEFKEVGTISEAEECYIAFSPIHKKSQEYANILSEGIKKLRESGELFEIYKKYGLKDFK